MNIQRVRAITGLLIVFMLGSIGASAGGNVSAEPASPRVIFIGQPVQPEEDRRWAEAEGTVTFAGTHGGELNLELSSGGGHMQVTGTLSDDDPAALLLGSRIRAEGRCVVVHGGGDGEMVGYLFISGWKNITILQVPQETWQRYPVQTIAGANRMMRTSSTERIVHLSGEIRGTNADGSYRFADETGEVNVHSLQDLSKMNGAEIEALATLKRTGSSPLFQIEVFQVTPKGENGGASALPVLTTTEQVRWLKPAEADRRYPVRVRAVVTFLLGSSDAAVGNLQDGTGGIYVWHLASSVAGVKVQPGDYCEVEGDTSAGQFSPGIYCHTLKVLGQGEFPDPVRPNWDELVSGSLDAQWVEIEGIVLSTSNFHLEVGVSGGRISCFVPDGDDLGHFLNAVVRVRGVVVADWDQSRHVLGAHLNLPSEKFISLEKPPLADPFSLPTKQIKDLLFYDPGESAFRREKVAGEIVGVRDGVCYLMNGTNGLRLIPKGDVKLTPGRVIEAVGFPEIDNSTPSPLITLWEATVKTTGQKPLPEARQLVPADALDSEYDSTLVRMEARLVHFGIYGEDQVLELQAGARTFFARLNLAAGRFAKLQAGSRVEATGVYVFNNGKSTGDDQAGPFNLLLNSPAELRVLELPSWWTSEHTLMVVGGMGVVILFGVVWIGLLRQQVGRRTAQLSATNHSLEAEIGERKRTENELVRTRLQHLVEQERTRIARDIHDELGSSLSQIRLLSEMTLSKDDEPAAIQPNSRKISAKALEATRVLDEIVWAVDPQNDTLESLLNYLFNFASEYLALAGIRFRIDAPTKIPHHMLTTQVRHQLYMAIKETLNNIVNHAQATEVWMRLRLEQGTACFVVEDNGRGFDFSSRTGDVPGASGVEYMRKRFNQIGGSFALESALNQGTRVKFVLPLTEEGKP